jgi:hypothetical protein
MPLLDQQVYSKWIAMVPQIGRIGRGAIKTARRQQA